MSELGEAASWALKTLAAHRAWVDVNDWLDGGANPEQGRVAERNYERAIDRVEVLLLVNLRDLAYPLRHKLLTEIWRAERAREHAVAAVQREAYTQLRLRWAEAR